MGLLKYCKAVAYLNFLSNIFIMLKLLNLVRLYGNAV